MVLEIDAIFERKLTCDSKMTWRIWKIFVHRLKNSDFILESKMGKLSQTKNSKQPNQPDAVWELYLTLQINE